ncbi:MAG: hypothetical protein AUK55_00565 [Syntrophobacteraceae bacterium CG2_30_61_12]|nr:MAG: hypothetical protein AUK55_00565 [Syntrophobacteraceae bacterium CG2_30_61_12]
MVDAFYNRDYLFNSDLITNSLEDSMEYLTIGISRHRSVDGLYKNSGVFAVRVEVPDIVEKRLEVDIDSGNVTASHRI